MRIDNRVQVYEGVRANTAVAMAFVEGTGIRSLIDERCRSVDGSCRTLSTCTIVKALVGAIYKGSKRTPFHLLDMVFGLCPMDKVFGIGVKPLSLSDTSLARCLNVIPKRTSKSCWGLLLDALRTLWTGLRHIVDGCDELLSLWHGDGGRWQGPHFGGNSETDCNDLIQESFHVFTNGNELLRMAKSFKSNTSDMRMNDDMIGFLVDKADLEKTVISADCKHAYETTIDSPLRLGWDFVIKASSNFNGLVWDLVAISAVI